MDYTALNLTNWSMEKVRAAQLAVPALPPDATPMYQVVHYASSWIQILKDLNQLEPVTLNEHAPWLITWTEGMSVQLTQLLGAFSANDVGYTSAQFQYSDADATPWLVEFKEQLNKAEQPLAKWRSRCAAGDGIRWDRTVQALQYTYTELYDHLPHVQLFTNVVAFYVAVDSAARQLMYMPLRVENVRAANRGRLRLSPSSGSNAVSSRITPSQLEERALNLRARGFSMIHHNGDWEMPDISD